MSRVLVVEGGPGPGVSGRLAREGFTVLTARERSEALESVVSFRPQLVLIEAPVPRGRSLDTCRVLRSATTVPMVLLSGPCTERDALAAFGVGLDSLVVEPVGHHELVARLRALLRRVPLDSATTHDQLVVGPIVLDRARRELRITGVLVPMPRREFDIAEVLMREAGRVVPRSVLVRELWGSMRDTKSLDVQVGRLRARLAAIEGVRRIVTVRGVGFRLLADDIEIDLTADPCDEPAPA